MDEGKEINACVLDFSKAFNKVSKSKLLLKLAHCGISFQVISWVDSFLSNRTQRVVVDAEATPATEVTSGVPQGSVIGPALFLFYINDLPTSVKSSIRLFADDTIVYNDADNHETLQEDLCNLERWEREWDMEFHPHKC